MSENYSVKSLVDAMRILECFTVQSPELGVSEIAKQLGMQKSKVHNVLNTFREIGYITQNPLNRRYKLGLRILHLGYVVNNHMGLRDILHPYLKRIAEAVHEVCYFGIENNGEVLYIEAVYPANQQYTRNILGERAPLYCTGLGKAMLAFLPPAQVDAVIAKGLRQFTPNTINNPETLQAQLAEIRENGYSIDNMEHEYGVRCAALPLFGLDKAVKGAVSISGPSPRFDPETITRHVAVMRDILAPLQNSL